MGGLPMGCVLLLLGAVLVTSIMTTFMIALVRMAKENEDWDRER
jgi:hypothetical protein